MLVLLSLSVPRLFGTTCSRSKRSECHTNLMALYTGERTVLGERLQLSTHPSEVGFAPERANRFLYLLDSEGPITTRSSATEQVPRGATGIGPDEYRYRDSGVRMDPDWLRSKLPPDLESELGIRGNCPACSITVACVGNLDPDDDVDVQSISTAPRIIDGEAVAPGAVYSHLNDMPDRPWWRRALGL